MEEVKKITHAKVRFIDGWEKRVVEVNSIVEFEDDPPKSPNDFDSKKIYTCWYRDDKFPELTKYGVQIGVLYGILNRNFSN